MKNGKIFRIAIVLAMLLSAFGASTTFAQGGLTYQSGVQVANLESAAATIYLYYYRQDGTLAIDAVQDTIPASGSKTYFPIQAAGGFNGSLVIQSDKKLAAIANLVTSDFKFSASTTSFDAGATSVSLPLVMCNNSGFFTFFNVQNAGQTDASVEINYVPGSKGSAYTENAVIKPGAAASFDQSTICATHLGTTFVGGATITSDQPVVATVMQLNAGSFPVLMGYNGFTGGSTSVALPLVMANNSGYYTGIQVQNAGSVSTEVTIDYSPNGYGTFNPANEVFTLAPGASATYIQSGGKWAGQGRYVGGAVITNSASQPLVAIVNQVNAIAAGQALGTAYEGFDPSKATANINAPLVMANNSGYYTGIQVQNVGAAACASVTVDYTPNTVSGSTFQPTDETFSLAAGASATKIQSGGQWTAKYIGSAIITAPGCSIVAIINQVATKTYDAFMTYDGFNY